MSSAQSPHRTPVATTDLLDLLTRFRWARGRMDDRVERDDYGPGNVWSKLKNSRLILVVEDRVVVRGS